MTPALVTKIENGAALSDQELREALVFYRDLTEKLLVLGPKFYLPFVECNRRAIDLEGSASHRGLK